MKRISALAFLNVALCSSFLVLGCASTAPTPKPTTATVEGTVYVSRDNHRTLEGMTVRLVDPALDASDPKAVIKSATTNNQGHYSFDGVAPGAYGLNGVYLIADPNAPALSGCSFSAIGFTADGWRYVTLTANQQRTIVATYGQDVGTKITVAAGQNALYDLHFGCN